MSGARGCFNCGGCMLIPFPCSRGEMLTGVIAVFALHTLWHPPVLRDNQNRSIVSLSFCVEYCAVVGMRVAFCPSDQHNLCWANVHY
ncbi:hypothetical protein K439DRAFT_1174069 [Ramaria rubella]|nr:hypothetical protein K439DRAFT_1174069 [Ramaria rubella]